MGGLEIVEHEVDCVAGRGDEEDLKERVVGGAGEEESPEEIEVAR